MQTGREVVDAAVDLLHGDHHDETDDQEVSYFAVEEMRRDDPLTGRVRRKPFGRR